MQNAPPDYQHPRLHALIERAQAIGRARVEPVSIGLVYPCDALALDAAQHIARSGMARPVLIGPREAIARAAEQAQVDLASAEWAGAGIEIVDASDAPASALAATALVRAGKLQALMKGSLHTDELMSANVNKATGLRGPAGQRISHVFLFDLPRYHKLLALADCVVNISPDLRTKQDILGNAVNLLQCLGRLGVEGLDRPKVGIVAAVETVNPAIAATVDAKALVDLSRSGAWPGALVEGPFGFDNVISAEAARIKNMQTHIAGDPDLLIMPDLNAGNMVYKSLNYLGGGDCAGLVLGASVPVVLTSRADSALSRLASVALAVLYSGQ